MRIHEQPNGTFEIYAPSRTAPVDTLDLAELVELRAEVDRVLMDYLARNISRLVLERGITPSSEP